ncbi:hypothetical protein [Brucella grignonensis]|uniref:TetR family transcriptional regulator n=1 Tax=Brucella grignonensis TaxID=94627 RepID=A0A256F7U1_9HYPH|nr:hypothetical protein [Brucella grignonensis]OYR10820.1 tetR family transcriptional regulator [Brucella grignonensis]
MALRKRFITFYCEQLDSELNTIPVNDGNGQAAGAWKIDNMRLLATLLFHALHDAVDDFIIRSGTIERTNMVRGVQDLFLKADRS